MGNPTSIPRFFSLPALGTPGTAPHRLFYGPGLANFDIALSKIVNLRESRSLQFRLETFNTFNHAQFFGPSSVNGEITSSAFGRSPQRRRTEVGPSRRQACVLINQSPRDVYYDCYA